MALYWPQGWGKKEKRIPSNLGSQVRCSWELFGGNMLGTWELFALTHRLHGSKDPT